VGGPVQGTTREGRKKLKSSGGEGVSERCSGKEKGKLQSANDG